MQRDAWAYGVAMLLARLQPLLETLLLTAILPVELFGRWAWAAALYMGVLSVAHGGIPAAVLRYSAQEGTDPYALLRFALQSVSRWAAGGMVALTILAWSVPEPIRYLVWAHLTALPAFLIAETLRAHLRGRYENMRLLRWQAFSVSMGLILMGGLTSGLGLWGAALTRLLQPLWLLAPAWMSLHAAWHAQKQPFQGFTRFGLHALWGNLALEALFFLPPWLIGWTTSSATLLAYWRWATLLPLNLRSFFALAVLYLYPAWVRSSQPQLLYRAVRVKLWAAATALAGGLAALGSLWALFPGEAYLPARPYYWGAIAVGWLWSTEALLLPNLLSAQGHIRAYSLAYTVGLLGALPAYLIAHHRLEGYLIGLGAAAVAASLTAYLALARLNPKRSL